MLCIQYEKWWILIKLEPPSPGSFSRMSEVIYACLLWNRFESNINTERCSYELRLKRKFAVLKPLRIMMERESFYIECWNFDSVMLERWDDDDDENDHRHVNDGNKLNYHETMQCENLFSNRLESEKEPNSVFVLFHNRTGLSNCWWLLLYHYSHNVFWNWLRKKIHSNSLQWFICEKLIGGLKIFKHF